MPEHYHWEWLSAACEIEDANNTIIVNPRVPINDATVQDIDMQWVTDKTRYRRWLKYEEDRELVQMAIGATG